MLLVMRVRGREKPRLHEVQTGRGHARRRRYVVIDVTRLPDAGAEVSGLHARADRTLESDPVRMIPHFGNPRLSSARGRQRWE
jgi:hypothetical protein